MIRCAKLAKYPVGLPALNPICPLSLRLGNCDVVASLQALTTLNPSFGALLDSALESTGLFDFEV